jgi:hypothetical protein
VEPEESVGGRAMEGGAEPTSPAALPH